MVEWFFAGRWGSLSVLSTPRLVPPIGINLKIEGPWHTENKRSFAFFLGRQVGGVFFLPLVAASTRRQGAIRALTNAGHEYTPRDISSQVVVVF